MDHLKLFHTDTPLAALSTPTGTAQTDTGVDASDQVGCDDHTVSVSDDNSEVDSDSRFKKIQEVFIATVTHRHIQNQ